MLSWSLPQPYLFSHIYFEVRKPIARHHTAWSDQFHSQSPVPTECFKNAGAPHEDLVSALRVLKSSEEGVTREAEQVTHDRSIPTHPSLSDVGPLLQKNVKKVTAKLLPS